MSKEVYLRNSISEIPRILSLTDRNANSPTYGCMYRVFWHDKATDIACAHPQLNVLALALATQIKHPNNPYFMNKNVMETCVASMNFWSRIQNNDGSFNEHYPNEHSYGATAWTLSSVVDSYFILNKFMDLEKRSRITESMIRAGKWLGRNEDPGPLTNHQAIAAWSLYRLFRLTNEKKFLDYYQKELKNVLDNQSEEGWYVEYDGPDLGYLTTSISFMAKLYAQSKDSRILDSVKKAVEFASYFVYPDNSYGGSVGYRDTTHFHPHGFELMAGKISAAASMKSKIIKGMESGNILKPAEMDDKYFGNLVIEYMRSYADYQRSNSGQLLPFQRLGTDKYFSDSKIMVSRKAGYYFVCNLAKGGAFKIFRKNKTIADSGFVALTKNKRLASTNWANDHAEIMLEGGKIKLKTNFFVVAKNFLDTKQLVASRTVMSTVGRNRLSAYLIKRFLIQKLITKTSKLKPIMEREIFLGANNILVTDIVKNNGNQLDSIAPAETFFHRYVPASRYFEPAELINKKTVFEKIGGSKSFKKCL